jgi:ketosteroid isomerase-like protein
MILNSNVLLILQKFEMTVLDIARSFVTAINAGDINRLAELMTADHTFIDSDGQEYSGRDRMRSGWIDYFSMVPDYKIEVTDTFYNDNLVVFLGMAEGTFSEAGKLKPENHWRVPAAWRAVVANNKVSRWQLYVNPVPMFKIFNRIKMPRPDDK